MESGFRKTFFCRVLINNENGMGDGGKKVSGVT